MKKKAKIIGILFNYLFVSCNHNSSKNNDYLNDPNISDNEGLPKEQTTFYYPFSIKLDNNIIKTGIDSFRMNWFSSTLYSAQEPILYNYYLGHDIYRFLWLRSFNRPFVFTLHKEQDKIWLTTKELNKEPQFLDQYSSVKFIVPTESQKNKGETIKVIVPKERKMIKKADRKADIIYNKTRNLTIKEWIEFEKLLKNCSFWSFQPQIEEIGLDGSQWVIEGHLKNNYWVIDRWSPKDNFRKAGEYLIEKSEIRERIY